MPEWGRGDRVQGVIQAEDEVTGMKKRSRLRGREVEGGPRERETPRNLDPTRRWERCPQQGLA